MVGDLLDQLSRRARERLRWQKWRSAAGETRRRRVIGDVDPATLHDAEAFEFRCNICGHTSTTALAALDRDTPTCGQCGSGVRIRAMAGLVVSEALGHRLALPDMAPAKQIRGIGLSDTPVYAGALAAQFAYVNTYLHTRPRLDLTRPDFRRYGGQDFIVASDVFEHVPPPVARAFENAQRLLAPGGKLIFSVPFSLDAETVEHFPDLHEWRIETAGGTFTLVNRAVDGTVTKHRHLVFHGGGGSTLEMRRFARAGLERYLSEAGFTRFRVASEHYLPFGIYWKNPWSVPMVAYR
jgi:SAM-dependent methyltransferase